MHYGKSPHPRRAPVTPPPGVETRRPAVLYISLEAFFLAPLAGYLGILGGE